MSKISQKDIANSLNISRVTVTKALMDHPDIAEKTRKLVKSRAMELGYIPDFIGRSLSSRKTQTIGLVIPKIAHSFFSYSVERFYFYAKEQGYHLIPMVSFEDAENERDNIQTLLSMRVDGLIIDIAENSIENEGYEFAKKSGCKVLFYDRYLIGSNDSYVTSNDYKSAKSLAEIAIKKGHKKIFHFAGPAQINIAFDRSQGFKDGTKKLTNARVFEVGMTYQSGFDQLMELHAQKDLPDAIIAVNDSVAQGVCDAAKKLGLAIPGDLGVAGFGDVETSKLLNPPLTSVQIPIDKMACEAISIMVSMIESEKSAIKQKVFESTIIERESL